MLFCQCSDGFSLCTNAVLLLNPQQNRRITVPSVVFEQATPEIRPLQSYNLDRTVNMNRRIQQNNQCPVKRKHTLLHTKIAYNGLYRKIPLYCGRCFKLHGCPAHQLFTDIQSLTVRTERCFNCVGNVFQSGRTFNNSEKKSVWLLLYLQTQSASFTEYKMTLQWHRKGLKCGAEGDTIQCSNIFKLLSYCSS